MSEAPASLPLLERRPAVVEQAVANLDLAGASGGRGNDKGATTASVVMQAVGLGLRAQPMAGRRRR